MPPYQRSSIGFGTVTRRGAIPVAEGGVRALAPAARRATAAPGVAAPAVAGEAASSLPWPVVAFLVALVVPWIINVGSLRLSPYRIVLLVMIVPCLLRLIGGRAGSIKLPDSLVILFSLWAMLCLGVLHGLETALQGGGILFVETAGAYLLARTYIRNADDFRNMVALLFKIVVFLLPFGVIEMVTGQKPLLQLFGTVLPTIDVTEMDRRWGFSRVQGPFEHPILFGVCCGSILAMTHMVLGYGQTLAGRWFKSAIVGGTTLLALSSGPLSAVAGLCMLLGWNWLFRNMKDRWTLLWSVMLALSLAVYVYSGQSIAHFYVSHAPLFDSWSAYYRLLIWEHGTQTIANHPLFGIGYNEYERPSWMASSVDMFWLNNAIMFGLPGGLFLAGMLVSAAWLVGRQTTDNTRLSDYRTGYLITLAFFFIVGWTVHFWNGTYSLFFFIVASGLWLADPLQVGTRVSPAARPARNLGTNAEVVRDEDETGVASGRLSKVDLRRQASPPRRFRRPHARTANQEGDA